MNYYSVGPEVSRIKFLTSGKIHNKCTAFQLNCNAVHLLWILPEVRKFRQLLKEGLDWTGLELDWSNLANSCRLM